MKFKYTGTVPAVLFQDNKLVDILPGEIVDFTSAPSSHFVEVEASSKKKKKTSPKKEKVSVAALDKAEEELVDNHIVHTADDSFTLRRG